VPGPGRGSRGRLNRRPARVNGFQPPLLKVHGRGGRWSPVQSCARPRPTEPNQTELRTGSTSALLLAQAAPAACGRYGPRAR
jgi:hypothetical protein